MIIIDYLGRCFHGRTIFQQKLDDFYSIFLAGDVQRREAILKQYLLKTTLQQNGETDNRRNPNSD